MRDLEKDLVYGPYGRNERACVITNHKTDGVSFAFTGGGHPVCVQVLFRELQLFREQDKISSHLFAHCGKLFMPPSEAGLSGAESELRQNKDRAETTKAGLGRNKDEAETVM